MSGYGEVAATTGVVRCTRAIGLPSTMLYAPGQLNSHTGNLNPCGSTEAGSPAHGTGHNRFAFVGHELKRLAAVGPADRDQPFQRDLLERRIGVAGSQLPQRVSHFAEFPCCCQLDGGPLQRRIL